MFQPTLHLSLPKNPSLRKLPGLVACYLEDHESRLINTLIRVISKYNYSYLIYDPFYEVP